MPRENSGGGVVGMLVKKSLRVKKLCSASFSSFENEVALAEHPIRSIRFVVIYRPPLSQIKAFLEDFASLLEQLVPISGNLLIVGDFNFHLDDSNNTDATKLHNLLESFNLKQHVATPTHPRGHTTSYHHSLRRWPSGWYRGHRSYLVGPFCCALHAETKQASSWIAWN